MSPLQLRNTNSNFGKKNRKKSWFNIEKFVGEVDFVSCLSGIFCLHLGNFLAIKAIHCFENHWNIKYFIPIFFLKKKKKSLFSWYFLVNINNEYWSCIEFINVLLKHTCWWKKRKHSNALKTSENLKLSLTNHLKGFHFVAKCDGLFDRY